MTTSAELLSTAVMPALAGLAVGFPAGVLTGILATLKWVARRRERGQPVPIYTEDRNPDPGHTPWRSKEHFSRLGWVFVALGLLGLVLGAIALYQNNRTSTCLAEYNANFTAATRERATAGELDRQGIRLQIAVTREWNAAIADSINNPPPPELRDQARRGFLDKINDWDRRLSEVDGLFDKAEQQRRENPLPTQPDC